jgi:2-hydroxychromene-2-carboxylate isomerase
MQISHRTELAPSTRAFSPPPTAWYLDGQKLGDFDALTHILTALGKAAQLVIDRANSDEIRARYEAETDAARKIGAFGSPTFGVDGEAFWGDDRLEEAIEWAVGRHPAQLARRA